MQHVTARFVGIDPWRALAWIGVLLHGVMLALAWEARQPALVLAMGIFLVACTALLLFVRQLPGLFALLVVISALLNAAGGMFQWFETYRWYDEAVHTYTGFAGLAALGYFYALTRPHRRAALVWWCAGMGLALGIAWEVIEGLVGDLEAVDTTTDLVFDAIGAVAGGLFARHALAQTTAE